MIVEKLWYVDERKHGKLHQRMLWKGYYLFGIIPLYIKMLEIRQY